MFKQTVTERCGYRVIKSAHTQAAWTHTRGLYYRTLYTGAVECVFTALHVLMSANRLFSTPRGRRRVLLAARSPCPVSRHMLRHVCEQQFNWTLVPDLQIVQNVTKVFFCFLIFQFTVQAVTTPPVKTEEISSSPKVVDNSTSQRTQHTVWVVNCHQRHIFRGLKSSKKLNLTLKWSSVYSAGSGTLCSKGMSRDLPKKRIKSLVVRIKTVGDEG